VRIGSTTCRNWAHGTWVRFPEIDRSFPVLGRTTRFSSPFGGLIYMEVDSRCDVPRISATISNAVAAPWFVLGETSNEQWMRIRDLPAPWAELQGRGMIVSIPSQYIRNLDESGCVDGGMGPDRPGAGRTGRAMLAGMHARRPERIVPDVQVCAGGLHAGYPIMGGIWEKDGWLDYVDLARLDGPKPMGLLP
jgi:hypothetical protein